MDLKLILCLDGQLAGIGHDAERMLLALPLEEPLVDGAEHVVVLGY